MSWQGTREKEKGSEPWAVWRASFASRSGPWRGTAEGLPRPVSIWNKLKYKLIQIKNFVQESGRRRCEEKGERSLPRRREEKKSYFFLWPWRRHHQLVVFINTNNKKYEINMGHKKEKESKGQRREEMEHGNTTKEISRGNLVERRRTPSARTIPC